jgi:hypothetical protein
MYFFTAISLLATIPLHRWEGDHGIRETPQNQ